MKKFLVLSITILLLPALAIASDYEAYSKDLVTPYGIYKKTLSLTSKKEDIEKAKDAVRQFSIAWDSFSAKYEKDIPKPFLSQSDFADRIRRPLNVCNKALSLLESGDNSGAHTVLEEIRYILWEMRTKAGIVSLNDKINDFHEAMEIVIEKTEHANDRKDLIGVYERYGAWLSIKWEEISLAKDYGTEEKTYTEVLSEGRTAIMKLNGALKSGDRETAIKMLSTVKNGYKRLFFMPI